MSISLTASGVRFNDGTIMGADAPIRHYGASLPGGVSYASITGIPNTAKTIWIHLSMSNAMVPVTVATSSSGGASAFHHNWFVQYSTSGVTGSIKGSTNPSNTKFTFNHTNSTAYNWRGRIVLNRWKYSTQNLYYSMDAQFSSCDLSDGTTGGSVISGGYVSFSSAGNYINALTVGAEGGGGVGSVTVYYV